MHRKAYRVTTDSAHAHPVAPNLLDRRFEGWAPDRAWVADITYVPTLQGWLGQILNHAIVSPLAAGDEDFEALLPWNLPRA